MKCSRCRKADPAWRCTTQPAGMGPYVLCPRCAYELCGDGASCPQCGSHNLAPYPTDVP